MVGDPTTCGLPSPLVRRVTIDVESETASSSIVGILVLSPRLILPGRWGIGKLPGGLTRDAVEDIIGIAVELEIIAGTELLLIILALVWLAPLAGNSPSSSSPAPEPEMPCAGFTFPISIFLRARLTTLGVVELEPPGFVATVGFVDLGEITGFSGALGLIQGFDAGRPVESFFFSAAAQIAATAVTLPPLPPLADRTS